MVSNPDPVVAFSEAVKRFRSWAEGPLTDAPDDLRRLRDLLAELHLLVLRLPEGFDDDAPELPRQAHAEWKSLLVKFQALPVDHYREVFDPFTDDEPVMGSLADDLADIYFDLREGLHLFEGGFPAGAAWIWRFTFQTHWGEHLTGAQRAVHWWFSREGALLP